ncbi:hypothetical protein [Streptomyces sp. NBC_00209]
MHTCSGKSANNHHQIWSWKIDYSSGHGLRLHTCSIASFRNGYQTWSK